MPRPGLPILCEKPCGVTADQAREAAAIAARHAVKLQVAYWRRFVPALQRLRQRIADGELGALYFVACYQWDGEPPPRAVPRQQRRHLRRYGRARVRPDPLAQRPGVVRGSTSAIASVQAAGDAESAQVLCTLSGGSTALVSLGRRFPLGDVCRVEAFGTRDAEDCRFLWPPDGERVFLRGAASARRRLSPRGCAAARRTARRAADAVAALAAAERSMAEGD